MNRVHEFWLQDVARVRSEAAEHAQQNMSKYRLEKEEAVRKNILVTNPKPKSPLQDDVKLALAKALSTKDRSLLVPCATLS